MAKHFDVAVLGGGLGALTAAALLARRSWRVRVVGQGYLPPRYTFEDVVLPRRVFTFLAASSPAWTRVTAELAQSQTWRRRLLPVEPAFQVMGPEVRLDVSADDAAFAAAAERELGLEARTVEDFRALVAARGAEMDAAVQKDVVIPPGGFWERRESIRALGSVFEGGAEIFAGIDAEHPLRRVVSLPAEFGSHGVAPLPKMALARLHGAWVRGLMALPRGEEDLVTFLSERVVAHGGEVDLGERASALYVRRGKVSGLEIAGDTSTGVDFVVSGGSSTELAALVRASGGELTGSRVAPPAVGARRFVVSLVVAAEGLPQLLAEEAFLVPSWAREGSTVRQPVVHLQRARVQAPVGAVVLVAEARFPSPVDVSRAREAILATVEEHLPFVERHYLVVDSPHDGRPLWDYRRGRLSGGRRVAVEVDRATLQRTGGSLEAEAMAPCWRVDGGGAEPDTLPGLVGEALRGPVGGTFLVGSSVLPSLGQEGEILAAWGAARIVTRTDRTKEKMRREMWTKVEID